MTSLGELIFPAALTTAGAVLIALIGGVFPLLAGRKKANADIQAELNRSFQTLMDELQEERKQYRERQDWYEERLSACNERIDALDNRVRALKRHVRELEDIMKGHGVAYPEMPAA